MNSWIGSVIERLGSAGVALLMALENVFPPIPSEVIMPLAGYTASQGELSLWLVITMGTLGTVVGTLPWYGIARWVGTERVNAWVDRHGHWLTVERRELERAERWFARRGRWMVGLGRLVPGIRTLISVPAGFCAMPLPSYLFYSSLGSLAWTALLAYLGSLLGKNYERVAGYVDPIAWTVLAAVFASYLVRLARMRRRNHARRRASSRGDASAE